MLTAIKDIAIDSNTIIVRLKNPLVPLNRLQSRKLTKKLKF